MAKEKTSEQEIPVTEIAQLIVSRAYSRIKDINQVVGSMSDAMDVLAEKFGDMSDTFLQIKGEINKYK